jgi:hypothetical protein
MTFPLPTNELPEQLRTVYARSDLSVIGRQAVEQMVVNDLELEMRVEHLRVIRENRHLVPPTLRELNRQYFPREFADVEALYESKNESSSTTIRGLASRGVQAGAKVSDGVSSRDVVVDVLAKLHPDIGEPDQRSEEAFKQLTNAQATGDRLLVQGLYAREVAWRSQTEPGLSAAKLAVLRYKGGIALRANQGRFDSIAALNEWHDHSVARSPYRMRAAMVVNVAQLFMHSLGFKEDERWLIPMDCVKPAEDSVNRATSLLEAVDSANTALWKLQAIDLGEFDARFNELVARLVPMMKFTGTALEDWTEHQITRTNQFAGRLLHVATSLEPPADAGQFSLFES